MAAFADFIGTLRSTFRINKATFDAAGLTALRTLTLQAQSGTLGHLVQTIQRPAGRVTLESGVAVSNTDQTAKTSVLYTPYVGELAPVYSGTVWTPTVFTELTLALDSDSGHTGYHQSGKNFDLFVVNDSGTIRLGTGPAWTSDTARGTGAGTSELDRKNGVWTNKVSMTLRFGSASGNTITVAANQGTYVGTIRASANGQCEDSLAKRFCWNTYNRVPRAMQRFESTDSWTYTTSTFRQMNNSTANQLAMVRGLDEDAVQAVATALADTSLSLNRVDNGIGVDSTTAFNGLPGDNITSNGAVAGRATLRATYFGLPGLGYHFLAALESSAGGGTTTWYGDAGSPSLFSNGIHGVVMA